MTALCPFPALAAASLLPSLPPHGCAVVGPLGSAEGSVGPSLVKEVRDRQQKGEGRGTRFQSSPGYLRGLCFRGPEAHPGPMGSSCKGGRVWPTWRHADRVWLLVGHCSRSFVGFPPSEKYPAVEGTSCQAGKLGPRPWECPIRRWMTATCQGCLERIPKGGLHGPSGGPFPSRRCTFSEV